MLTCNYSLILNELFVAYTYINMHTKLQLDSLYLIVRRSQTTSVNDHMYIIPITCDFHHSLDNVQTRGFQIVKDACTLLTLFTKEMNGAYNR
jgi:hypothetical protein